MTRMDALILDGAERVGQFGPIWSGFENDPAGAIEKLIAEQDGEVPHAYKHPIIGWIGLVYGNENMGLRHVAEKRGWEFVRTLPSVLRHGRLVKHPKLPKFYLAEPGDPASVAVVRLDFDGMSKTWVVTMYRDTDGRFATLDGVGRGRTSHVPPVPPATAIPAGTLGEGYSPLREKQANACGVVLDKATPIQRVALVRSLGEAMVQLKEAASPVAKITAAKAVAGILSALGAGAAEAGAKEAPLLRIDVADPEGSLAAIERYAYGGLEHLPEALRDPEMRMIATLAHALGGKSLASRLRQSGLSQASWTDDAQVGVFKAVAARGLNVPLDLSALGQKVADRDAAMAAYVSARRETIDRVNADLTKLSDGIRRLQNEARAQMRTAMSDGDLRAHRKIQDELEDAWIKYRDDFAMVRAQAVRAQAEMIDPPPGASGVDLAQEGEIVLSTVLASSKISDSEAKAWAARQTVTKQGISYLKRQGYTEAALRKDMADFYRISGGKIAEIEVGVAGRGRAHASGISAATGRKFIGAGKTFNRTVLFHELAHHIEADEIAKAAANGFLIKRRKSSRPVSLARLTGNRGYSASEVAYEDQFISPYIGKVYRDGVTEVYSMGVQYLATPADAAMFAAKDPEMFALVTGYLAGELTPAMKGLIALHTGATDARRDEEAKTEDEFGEALKQLASGITLDTGVLPERLASDERFMRAVEREAKRGSVPRYVGSPDGNYHVFEGTFKDTNTRRYAKGHLVVYDTGGHPDLAAVHFGLDGAKALIALSQRNGQELRRTARTYFWSYSGLSDTRKVLIGAAKGASA